MQVVGYGEKPEYFLNICDVECIQSFQTKVESLTQNDWTAWTNRRIFADQKYSLTIPIINRADRENYVFRHNIFNNYYYEMFEKELNWLFDRIEQRYPSGEPKRVMFINLPAGCDVDLHLDNGYHLTSSRRIHLPIITNDQVDFGVGDVLVPMLAGKLIEINNNKPHFVKNKSDKDRVHLLIDWNTKEDPFYTTNY